MGKNWLGLGSDGQKLVGIWPTMGKKYPRVWAAMGKN